MTVTNDRVSDFDGYSGLDLEINLCEGDDLIITREPDWAGHDLYIDGGIDGAIDFNQNTGTIEDPMAGTYNYYCTVAGHEEMLGTIKVLPSSDPTCQCEEGGDGGESEAPVETIDCVASSDESADGTDGQFYCINGGTVSGTASNCVCTGCNPGYSGNNCHTADPCTGTTTDLSANGDNGVLYCINGGTVGGTTGECVCYGCDPGWEGGSCQTAKQCTASTDPGKDGSDGEFYCVNGGTVSGTTGNCECTDCNTGWGGASCHVDIDFCVVSSPTTIWVGEQRLSLETSDLPHFDFYVDEACTTKLPLLTGLAAPALQQRTYGVSANTEYTFKTCTRDSMHIAHAVKIYSVEDISDTSGHNGATAIVMSSELTITTGDNGALLRYNDDLDNSYSYGFFQSIPFQHGCKNGGACQDRNATYECDCTDAPGYEGPYCTTDTDECAVGDGSLGNCVSDQTDSCADSTDDDSIPIDDYTCTCKPGFKGKNCETNINDCLRLNNGDPGASPCESEGGDCQPVCKNDASCEDGVESYVCTCKVEDGYTESGWEGAECHLSVNDCGANDDENPCLHGATCHDDHLIHTCNCTAANEGHDYGNKWYNDPHKNEINCDSKVVEGCMKPDKINYNEIATHDYGDNKCKDGADVYELDGYTDKKIRMGKWEKMQKRKYEKSGRADGKSYNDFKQRKQIRKNDRIAIAEADFKEEVWAKLNAGDYATRPKKLEVGPVSHGTAEKCAEKATDDYVGDSDDCVTTVLDEEDDDEVSGKKTLTRRVIPKAEDDTKENWQVVGKKDANNVVKPIIKQTRKFNDKYTMKCWDEATKTWNGPVLGGKTENIEEGEEFMCADTRHRVLVGGVTDYPAPCVLTSCTAEQKHEAYTNRNIGNACDGETADEDRAFAPAESDESGCQTLGCTAQQLVDSFTCDL